MSDNPPAADIAVVVVSYNSGRFLARCLEALAAQQVPAKRVLVVDNASSDDSAEICRRFPFVELHAADGNLGFARANNLAVAQLADCEWIALLNPDAFAAPDWIRKLEEATRRAPDIDEFACRLVSAGDHRLLDGAGDAYATSGAAWPRFQGAEVGTEGNEPHEVFGSCGAAALYRRSTFLAAEGFDENFFCYYEDVDLSFRLRLRGHRCLYLPEAVVHHVGSGITGAGSDFSVYYSHRNVVWTYVKNMPGGYLWLYLPRHLLLNVGSLINFALKGRFTVIARAKWHALRALPRVLRQRREMQATRRCAPVDVLRHMEHNAILPSMFRRAARRVSAALKSHR